ncbi:hypothetical protein [Clostridium sp. C105KSO13]|uniref:hypothetical protein n=1 Tax=Clostridium sp. C105KSO13 TaxID=1776045 RepID=UPI00325A44EA
MDTFRKECERWIQHDEDVLTYTLFPQVAVDFYKNREAQQTKVDPDMTDKKNGVIRYKKLENNLSKLKNGHRMQTGSILCPFNYLDLILI